MDEIDESKCTEELAKAKAAMEASKTDEEKAENRIGVEVLSAMLRSIK